MLMQAAIFVRRIAGFLGLAALAVVLFARSSYADAGPKWTDAQLAGFSEVILRGRTARVAAGRDDPAGPIYTYVSIQVVDVLKGSIRDAEVTIKQLGGRVGDRELYIAGQPSFAVGEDVLLFLEVRPRDRTLTTTAGWQGKFTIVRNASGERATRQPPAGSARGSFGVDTRPLASWVPTLRGVIGRMPAAQSVDVVGAPPESASAVDAVVEPIDKPWLARGTVRLDLVAPADALSGGGDRVLRRAADFWTGTGFATLLAGGLQPAGCFTTNALDGRIAVGADGCGELSTVGGTVALSGAWLDHVNAEGAKRAGPRFLGGGAIVNRGAIATRLLSRASCLEQVIAHEIGHALGFADLPDGSGVMGSASACDAASLGSIAAPAGADDRPAFVPLTAERTAVGCVIGCDIKAAAGISVPRPPTDLTFTLVGSTLTLNWTAPSAGAAPTTYVIEAGTTPGGVDVANFQTGSLATSFSAFVGGSATFFIRVRAANFYGPSDPSNEITVIVGGTANPPNAPQGLSASVSGSDVTLTWNAPVGGGTVSTYIIEAGSSPGASNLASFSTGSTATSFFAPGVGAGTYFVRVRASNAGGTSAPSNEVVIIVGSGCPAPSAPSGLTASVAGSTVTLNWTAGAGATSYRLQAGSSPGQSNLADFDIGSAATTLVATNVGAGSYFVRVRSVNSCAIGDPSNEILVIVR